MSGQILQKEAESWKSCIRVAYLPIAVYTMNLKDKLLGFHHCPWAVGPWLLLQGSQHPISRHATKQPYTLGSM